MVKKVTPQMDELLDYLKWAAAAFYSISGTANDDRYDVGLDANNYSYELQRVVREYEPDFNVQDEYESNYDLEIP